MEHQDLYSGLIRLHILHHAAKEPIFGLAIIEELARHGYRLSAGTLYPLLHGLEGRGYLRSKSLRAGKRLRRVYRATPLGRRVLEDAKEKVRELFGELLEEEDEEAEEELREAPALELVSGGRKARGQGGRRASGRRPKGEPR